MSEHSKIEWTDATWNPITGCSLVSEGCRNCYAAELAAGRLKAHPSRKGLARRNADGVAKFTGHVRWNEEWLDQPLRWRRPRMIFVCAHGDLFHERVPDAWIDRMFAVMALRPQHTFQVLTKRPERMRAYFGHEQEPYRVDWSCDLIVAHSRAPSVHLGQDYEPATWPLPNVWLGTSCEDQAMADERIPHLLATPAAVRFVSLEPLLGPIDLTGFIPAMMPVRDPIKPRTEWGRRPVALWGPTLDWVIVGGESGPHARVNDTRWVRPIIAQCRAAGVPVFNKQAGRRCRMSRADAVNACVLGAGWRADGPGADYGVVEFVDRKGGDPAEWPDDLRVRELPGMSVREAA